MRTHGFQLSVTQIFVSFSLTASLLITGCASGPSYNETVYPFELDEEKLSASPLQSVVIPHVNLGSPSRKYLRNTEARIDARLGAYLKNAGIKVLPQRDFKQHWNTAVRAFGDPVDPTNGKVNMRTFAQIMQSVRDRYAEDGGPDAFLFTDLVELEVAFSNGLKHLARWDGVARRPSLQGPGNGVNAGFDWSLPASVASLQVTVFDTNLQRLFVSRGGLDATDAIDTRSSAGRYIRRRSILENNTHIDEGISLALHPLVPMKKYPGDA
ncbi:MAG: hypothetical protein AAF098_11340 [Pseudomonadota bacterium]